MVTGLLTGWVSDRMRDRRLIIGVTGLAGAAGALCVALLRDYGLPLVTSLVFASTGTEGSGNCSPTRTSSRPRGREVTFFTSIMRSLFSAAFTVGPPVALFVMMIALINTLS
jgi:MFS family permease